MTEAAPPPFFTKPRLRGVSHQWAFFVSVVIGALLVLFAPDGEARLAATIYAVSVAGLFGASALYHRVNWSTAGARRWMRRLDHSMIFVLIAGTYTPFALLVLNGTLATVILLVVWGGAVGGVILKLVWIDAPKALIAAVYVMLGWVAVATVPAAARGAGRGRHGAGGGRRAALHHRRGGLRPPASRPGPHCLRLPRGLPRAGDRRGGAAVRRGRVLRPSQRLSLTYSAFSHASPAQAWALVSEPERWSEWAPHLRGAWGLGRPEVEQGRSGAARLLGVVPVPAKITDKKPSRSWAWRVGPVTMDHIVRAAPGGCEIAVEMRAAMPLEVALRASYGPVVALLVRNLARVAERQDRQ